MSDPVVRGARPGAPAHPEWVAPPTLPWDVDTWSEEARRSYRVALRRLGLVAEPRLAVYDAGAPAEAGPGLAPLFERADEVLVALWSAGDPESRVPVAEALAHVDAMRGVDPDVNGP